MQSPSVSLPSGDGLSTPGTNLECLTDVLQSVRVPVDAIMQAVGLRSQVSTSNSTITFRAACRDFSPAMGIDVIFFTQGAVGTFFPPRNYFAAVSYPDGTIKLATGRTQSIVRGGGDVIPS